MIAPNLPGERDHQRITLDQSATAIVFDGLVRDRDPETSWDAATGQTTEKINARQRAILVALHRFGAMSDEQIIDRLDVMRAFDHSIPLSTPQAFRTARKALSVGGQVLDAGRRVRTRTGRTAIVWQPKGGEPL